MNLHDSCGVHNLHGIPGVLGGLLSALAVRHQSLTPFPAIRSSSARCLTELCSLATQETYGPALYLVLGNLAPQNGTEELALLQTQVFILY